MPRVASLYLPNLSTDRVRASEREGRREGISSSPAFRGRGGTQAEGLGGEGLADSGVQTLTSHRFAAGPSSPVNTGEGREPCSCPNESHWRPGARWARAKFTKKTSDSMNFVNFAPDEKPPLLLS